MTEVKIIDAPYTVRDETIHQYQAYCTSCLRFAQGPTGIGTWASKPPAVKAARAHLDNHGHMESYLDRLVTDGRARIVGSIE